uniref:FHA domain-containing protein At4g14490-like n=1 Tax=Erigeron canadensis TaxID=72917 RepID=UPI001CB8A108|nr:FHA domain-containing protein At4g14490-like [Erigeron canadensis]
MSSKLKIIIEKGPREGETLEYDPTSVIKIGRVARGNTIAIKDAGISSKHICIQFDKQLQKWTLIDLDSSNGTLLNGLDLKPYVSSSLSDGDCVKIGELTSMIVKIGTEIEVVGPSDRRNGKGVAVVESELGFGQGKAVEEVAQKRNLRGRGKKVEAAVDEKANAVEVVQKRDLRGRGKKGVDVEREKAAVEEDLQKSDLRGRGKRGVEVESEKAVVEQDVQKRDLRARGKRGVDVKIQVESLSTKRVLRSSKKGENVNVDVREMGEDVYVLTESKKTRGGRKKLPVKVVEDSALDGGKLGENGVSVEVKRTGRGRGRPRKMMKVEPLEENNAKEYVQVGEGNEGDFDKGKADLLEKVENLSFVENLDVNNESVQDLLVEKLDTINECVQDLLVEKLDTNNECVQDDLADKLVLRQEDCEGNGAVVDGSLVKSPSEIADVDKEKEAVVDGSLVKSPSEIADMDKGKELAEELEYSQDGSEGMVNDSGPDESRWVDLEKMTLGDFFDYLEVQLPKEIHEKIEKINSDLRETARKCHELRLQADENRKG